MIQSDLSRSESITSNITHPQLSNLKSMDPVAKDFRKIRAEELRNRHPLRKCHREALVETLSTFDA